MPQTYSTGPPIERPRCSRCTSGMKLALIIHGPMTFENRRFECPQCNYVQNQIVATDPMQSAYLGWLAGELMAPN
jgi:ribosomal protein S27AE